MAPSSLPWSVAVKGGSSCVTVAIGLPGVVIEGGLLLGTQTETPEARLCGLGGPVVKSAPLLFVSVQPPLRRSAAGVFVVAAVGPAPSKQFAVPSPTKSAMNEPVGQAPVSATDETTRAILPPVAPMAIRPVASGVGRFVVPPAPWDS